MLPLRRPGLILFVALAVFVDARGAEAKPAKKFASPTSIKGQEHAKASVAKSKGGAKGVQSIGAPNAGKLAGSIRLKGSRYLRQRKDAHSWGLPVLVRLVQRASVRVANKHQGSVMLVGDLSGRAGGPLEGHRSHQSGRDADIGFYVLNSRGKPVNVKHFVAFDSSGKGRELPWATFDEARNWTLIETLLNDPKALVRYLFINNGLRARLLAYAARKHMPKEIISRAAAAMMTSKDVDLHDDHLHVRIACPESMREVCSEESASRRDVAKTGHAGEIDAVDAKAGGADAPKADVKPEVDADAPGADGASQGSP